MTDQNLCRVLTGPTGIGKSEWALALAEENGWEILCMDSMQIYRRMDIGTAKPTPAERERVPHHLLDLVEPSESFSVAAYAEAAEKAIQDCARRGKGCLFVGGTGLYLDAMMHGLSMGGFQADPARRQEMLALGETPEGRRALMNRLRALDPVTASRLPEGDVRRVIRAIEVTEKTGVPFSAQTRENGSSHRWIVVSLTMQREHLYRRINVRAERMMRGGLPEEVAGLLKEGVPEDAQSMQAIGYRQVIPLLRGCCTEAETLREIQTATRHYAKRQMTFLRREPSIVYLDAEDPDIADHLRKAME